MTPALGRGSGTVYLRLCRQAPSRPPTGTGPIPGWGNPAIQLGLERGSSLLDGGNDEKTLEVSGRDHASGETNRGRCGGTVVGGRPGARLTAREAEAQAGQPHSGAHLGVTRRPWGPPAAPPLILEAARVHTASLPESARWVPPPLPMDSGTLSWLGLLGSLE